MYLNVERFTNYCSFDYTFDDDLDWTSCTANLHLSSGHPFHLNLSSSYFGDLSYVIAPLDRHSSVLIDLDQERACLFNPSKSVEDIAEDIDEVIEDDVISTLIAFTLISLCSSKMK